MHGSVAVQGKRNGCVGACCTRRGHLCRRIAASVQLICTTELHRAVRGSRGGFVRRGASAIVASERFGLHRALHFNAALLFARSAQGCIQLACFAQRRCPTIRWSRRLKQLRFHFASVVARLNSSVGLLAENRTMKRQSHRSLEAWRQRRGARSVQVARAAVACAVASRLRSSSSARLSYIALSGAVGVASFCAGLRYSSRRRVRVASRSAVQPSVAVRSVSSGLHRTRLLRPASLPNNSFEPTLETTAASLRVSAGAAQLNYRGGASDEEQSLAVLGFSGACACGDR